jgi:hypothetical protein
METGIYTITSSVSGKFYIGSASVSFKQRWRAHLYSLRKGDHCNSKLQRAWLREIGNTKASMCSVAECCRGVKKSAYGFHWQYIDNPLTTT